MKKALFLVSVYCLSLLGSAYAVDKKAVIRHGEAAAREIFAGTVISREMIINYLSDIDVSSGDVESSHPNTTFDSHAIEDYFKDESDEKQEETLKNFRLFFEGATPEQELGLALLTNQMIFNLR